MKSERQRRDEAGMRRMIAAWCRTIGRKDAAGALAASHRPRQLVSDAAAA